MKAGFTLVAAAAACLATAAAAQMGPGMGPGMMGGQGMGPRMMGGRAMGAGTMGGPAGCPMGQSMMGGPGMGQGMMDGPGMGHGMMGGARWAALEALDLSDEQRGKVTENRRELQRKKHALMGSLRELRWQAEDAAKSAELDEAAARKRFDAGAAIRKQMFEAHLEAYKRIQEVLTREQREELRKNPGRGPWGPAAHH